MFFLKSYFLIFFCFIIFIIGDSSSYLILPKSSKGQNNGSGVISLEFCVVTENELLIVPIKIGSPDQEMNLVLDISSERTWISDTIYSKENSETYRSNEFFDYKEQDNFSYRGIWGKETFTLGEKNLDDFDFCLVNEIKNNDLFQGVLSLGREYDSKKFSIVYRMSASTATFYNSFVLRFDDQNKGELYIGDLTQEIRDYGHLVHYCTLVNVQPLIKWGCMLTHIFVGEFGEEGYNDPYTGEKGYYIKSKQNKILNVDEPAFFETIYNKIYVPKHFMDYLGANVFVDNFGKKLCQSYSNENSIKIVCKKEEIESVKKINFVLSSKLALSLSGKDLFECTGDKCEYLIVYDSSHSGWSMGLIIMKI